MPSCSRFDCSCSADATWLLVTAMRMSSRLNARACSAARSRASGPTFPEKCCTAPAEQRPVVVQAGGGGGGDGGWRVRRERARYSSARAVRLTRWLRLRGRRSRARADADDEAKPWAVRRPSPSAPSCPWLLPAPPAPAAAAPSPPPPRSSSLGSGPSRRRSPMADACVAIVQAGGPWEEECHVMHCDAQSGGQHASWPSGHGRTVRPCGTPQRLLCHPPRPGWPKRRQPPSPPAPGPASAMPWPWTPGGGRKPPALLLQAHRLCWECRSG